MIEINPNASQCIGQLITDFVDSTGAGPDGPETILADLLTDLHHWADANDASWQNALTRALDRHAEEVAPAKADTHTLYRRSVTPGQLASVMEIGHVIRVHMDGSISEPGDVWAPEWCWNGLSGEAWRLMDGYSSQRGYSGAHMHRSEYIGGRMAADILAHPGLYAAIVIHECTDDCGDIECAQEGDSWAVAYIPE